MRRTAAMRALQGHLDGAGIEGTVSSVAASHLESAFGFIAQDHAHAAGAVVDRNLSAFEALARNPEMGRIGRVPRTRELVVTGTPFIVAYRVREDHIEVLAVLHGARRWPERLE